MNIELEKIKLAQQIFTIESEELLVKIKEFISNEQVDIWDELPVEMKASIDRGIQQAENGQMLSHAEAVKKLKRWH
ncbi:hypothetical protein AEM51_09750 [Bacteroidetes bacterium UKL13-3]|jgi:hypothetical protein|nr:hypothetical protein AEM51_09750 [Bacteroidetes bacterium UKL13-3]HCP93861.1 hypothetical protein [Bacteroidota bacterium]